MDRNALLLYLRNVRDLEVARHIIKTQYHQQKTDYENKLKNIQTTPNLAEYPQREKGQGGCCFVFCYMAAILSAVLLFILLNQSPTGLDMAETVVVFSFVIFLFILFVLGAYWLKPESQKSYDEWVENEKRKVDAYNESQREIVREGLAEKKQLSDEWKQTANWYNNEYNKLTNLLNKFYAMNILANQYRNLASVIYIYDYMSSSRASLNDTLIHEHMESGIQRLETKLDQVINRISDVIYETRCMRSENKSMVERQVLHDKKMLRELQAIASNSQDAAFYSQLASNYSEANAYLSLANYLKR